MEKAKKRVIVLDTSAFIAGFDPFAVDEEEYTAPLVKDELSSNSLASLRLETAIRNRKVKVKMPSREFLTKAKEHSKTLGDVFFLSEADVQVLALALELKDAGYAPLIATDDYSVQNVANQMGVEFASISTLGIKFKFHWVRYCPACRHKYPPNYKSDTCQICGTKLKRKPRKKSSLNRHQKKT